MTVTSCKLDPEFDLNGSSDKKYKHSYNLRFIVETDDPLDSLAQIETDCLNPVLTPGFDHKLPPKWSTYNESNADPLLDYSYFTGLGDPWSFLKDYSWSKPDALNKPERWACDCAYTPLDPNEDQGDSDTDPLARPTKFWMEHESEQKIIEEDNAGVPLLNSAGYEFTEPPTTDRYYAVLVAQYNVATLAEVINVNNLYTDTVNSTGWQGTGARTWRLRTIGSSLVQTETDQTYYTLTYRFILKHDNWDFKIVDRGFQYKEDAGDPDGDGVRAVDKNGEPTPEPVLLAADGTKLPPGQQGLLKEFRVFREADYNSIAFP